MENEKIIKLFEDCLSGERPNGKFQLLRIYGAYERERKEMEKDKPLDEQLRKCNRRYTIHRISDNMAIVEYHEKMFDRDIDSWFSPTLGERISCNVYDSFDKALIALVAMKSNDIEASEYIFKMLGMDNCYDSQGN